LRVVDHPVFAQVKKIIYYWILYSSFHAYHPKTIRPIAIGVKMVIMITQGMGLLISAFPCRSILKIAPVISITMDTMPMSIHKRPKVRLSWFITTN